jgi:hypothetical protein
MCVVYLGGRRLSRGFWGLSGGFSLEPLEGTATGLEPSHTAQGVAPLMGIGVPVRRGVVDRPDHAARVDNVLRGLRAWGTGSGGIYSWL